MALPMTPVPIQPIVVRSGVAGASGLTTRRSRYKSTLATCKEGLYAAAPTAPTTTGGYVVRAGTGSRSTVRWLALGVALVVGFAACSSGGDDDDGASGGDRDTDTSTSAPDGRHHRARGRPDEPLRQARHLLRTGERGAGGGARGDRRRDHRGLDLDHAHPRDARGPRGSRVRDPDRRSRRPGGDVRRDHQRPLRRHQRAAARPQPRGGAADRARGPGPERHRAGGVHRGHRGQQRRLRVLGQRLGRAGRRDLRHRCARHDLPDDLQRHAGGSRGGRQPPLLDDGRRRPTASSTSPAPSTSRARSTARRSAS